MTDRELLELEHEMTTLREAAQQALEALENSSPDRYPEDAGVFYAAKDALRAALAEEALQVMADNASDIGLSYEPVQEPVAWIQSDHLQKARQAPCLCRVEPTQRFADFLPLYTHPVDDTALLRQALEALENPDGVDEQNRSLSDTAITALRERLEGKV